MEGDKSTKTLKGDGMQPDAIASKAEELRFTQADVNRIVSKEKAQAYSKGKSEIDIDSVSEQAINSFRDEMGLTDDVLQQLANRDKEAIEKRQLKSTMTKISKEKDAIQSERDFFKNIVYNDRTKTAVMLAAAEKSVDPESVYLNLKSKLDLDEKCNVQILDDNGQLDPEQTIEKLIDNFLTKKPHLAKPTNTGIGAGSRVDRIDPGSKANLKTDTAEERAGALMKLTKGLYS